MILQEKHPKDADQEISGYYCASNRFSVYNLGGRSNKLFRTDPAQTIFQTVLITLYNQKVKMEER